MTEMSRERTARAIWIYLRAIDEIPALEPGEAERLARAAREGDHTAGPALARAFLRLPARIAFELGKPGQPPLLLIREGNRELLRAAESYRPESSLSFKKYAAGRIEAAVGRILDSGRRD